MRLVRKVRGKRLGETCKKRRRRKRFWGLGGGQEVCRTIGELAKLHFTGTDKRDS